ncbi:MAG: 2-isopropylmalate synthase, partial [Syntrophomonadaceae bacterium]|nr:2-isopropylmalate synthase [Syntrophomonadaceae bacterium]
EVVGINAEDASRTDLEFLKDFGLAGKEAGAQILRYCDTLGYDDPFSISERIAWLAREVGMPLELHCHNDLGLAVANSLAAVVNGAAQVECTINGIGERAGNASLEEIVMALYTKKAYFQREVGINYREIARTSRLVSALTGMVVQPNKAIVGKNAFAHESGIHQDGVLKERTTYEIMSPELIGVYQSNLVLGKHSGRHAFAERLRELGFELSEQELEKAFRRFKDLADRKKEVTNEDLEAIVKDEVWAVPEKFRLNYLYFASGTRLIPTATVGISIDGIVFEDAGTGDGPVDAALHVVDKLTGLQGKLLEYKLNAVTEGKDALGEVVAKVNVGARNYIGRGVSTDVVEASVRAYLNAMNKAIFDIERGQAGPRIDLEEPVEGDTALGE